VTKGVSLASQSEVSRSAASASVRAMTSVGTPQTSAAKRAAISFLHGFLRRHQHLATHVAAFLDRSELVFPVHAGSTGADHRLHQFESVQHATKAGFGIGDDRREVVDVALVAGVDVLEYWISSARRKELLMRSTTFGTESTGYSDWSGYIAA
jgi:hypothetical protein